MSYANRQPVSNGWRANGTLVNQFVNGKVAPGASRGNFSWILRGKDDDIHIVATGEQALALWSRAVDDDSPRPTVIVAAGLVHYATALQPSRPYWLLRRSLAESWHQPIALPSRKTYPPPRAGMCTFSKKNGRLQKDGRSKRPRAEAEQLRKLADDEQQRMD